MKNEKLLNTSFPVFFPYSLIGDPNGFDLTEVGPPEFCGVADLAVVDADTGTVFAAVFANLGGGRVVMVALNEHVLDRLKSIVTTPPVATAN